MVAEVREAVTRVRATGAALSTLLRERWWSGAAARAMLERTLAPPGGPGWPLEPWPPRPSAGPAALEATPPPLTGQVTLVTHARLVWHTRAIADLCAHWSETPRSVSLVAIHQASVRDRRDGTRRWAYSVALQGVAAHAARAIALMRALDGFLKTDGTRFIHPEPWAELVRHAPPTTAAPLLARLGAAAAAGRAHSPTAEHVSRALLGEPLPAWWDPGPTMPPALPAAWWGRFTRDDLAPLLASPFAPLRLAAATFGVAQTSAAAAPRVADPAAPPAPRRHP